MMEYDRAYASEWLRKEELAVGLGKLLEEKELLASFGMIWGDLFSELDRGEAVLHARERYLFHFLGIVFVFILIFRPSLGY